MEDDPVNNVLYIVARACPHVTVTYDADAGEFAVCLRDNVSPAYITDVVYAAAGKAFWLEKLWKESNS